MLEHHDSHVNANWYAAATQVLHDELTGKWPREPFGRSPAGA